MLDTFLMAVSISVMSRASQLVVPVPPETSATAEVTPDAPVRSERETSIVSPWFAPTWKVVVPEPSSRLMPLNAVLARMSVISVASCLASATIAALSSVLRVPLLYCTFRSRTRWSIECTSLRAPSAVWTSEMPSCALRCAWARPPI